MPANPSTMSEPGMAFESGGEDKARQDVRTKHEGRLVDLSGEFLKGDRIRLWERGVHSHETIVSASYGKTLECEYRQDVDANPIEGKVIETLTRIDVDGDDSWTAVKHEKPKWEGSILYKAVLADGSSVYIEKYPPGAEISENRDKQRAQEGTTK